MNEKFPVISIRQFVLLLCEVETGIILNKDLERYIGQGECYYVFNSLEEAENFSFNITNEKTNIESTIYSYDESVVKVIKNESYINQVLKPTKKKKWFIKRK